MKKVTLTGALIVIAIAIAGLVIASSASPTALCEDEPKEGLCKKTGGIEEAETTSAVFETSVGKITCHGYVEFYGSEPATPKGVALKGSAPVSFSSCLREGGGSCTAKVTHTYAATLSWTSGSNGTLLFNSNEKGPPNVTITCTAVIECTYTFESAFDVNGGKEATVVASKDALGGATGALCPGSGAAIALTATFKTPTPAYVGATIPPVNLCKANETPCTSENTYAVPTTFSAGLEAGSTAKLRLKITEESEETEYTVSCASSTLEGKTTAAKWPMTGEISALSFGECGDTCSAKALKLPFSVQLEASGSGNGTITFLGTAPHLRVRCIGAYKCTYESGSQSMPVTGGTPAKLSVNASINKLTTTESDTKCGAEVKWEGTYRFTKPEASGTAKMWVVREGI
jgi:hypothetical protein